MAIKLSDVHAKLRRAAKGISFPYGRGEGPSLTVEGTARSPSAAWCTARITAGAEDMVCLVARTDPEEQEGVRLSSK
ncbi:hypothetical protein [Streptomyces xanthophaeus]|uniref:hypothetical protein n=1 Tax=Streptomyces xanthophaeus TaxID=67385 RepID=UPI00264A02B5|nr:hypothetical protein [Streptomyces xanthophaeus]WKD36173.1 hypothetical protein KO717_32335 [Streptomyces xanthophaeus]